MSTPRLKAALRRSEEAAARTVTRPRRAWRSNVSQVKRLVVLCVAALGLMATGCALSNDVAASVNGKKITVDQVVEFSKEIQADLASKAAAGAATVPPTTTDIGVNADPARLALGVLFASSLSSEALGQWKVPVDEAAIDQQLAKVEGTPTPTQRLFARLTAAENQLLQGLPDHWDTPLGQRFLTLKSRPTCVEGVAGAADQKDAIQKLLDGGASLTDATAFAGAGASPLGQQANQFCFSSPEELPKELQEPWSMPASPVIKNVEFVPPRSGKLVVFFRTLGATTKNVSDPAFRDSVKPSQADTIVLRLAAIDVLNASLDPRFGTFDPSTGVAAPASPNPAFSATATAADRAKATQTAAAQAAAQQQGAAQQQSSAQPQGAAQQQGSAQSR